MNHIPIVDLTNVSVWSHCDLVDVHVLLPETMLLGRSSLNMTLGDLHLAMYDRSKLGLELLAIHFPHIATENWKLYFDPRAAVRAFYGSENIFDIFAGKYGSPDAVVLPGLILSRRGGRKMWYECGTRMVSDLSDPYSHAIANA